MLDDQLLPRGLWIEGPDGAAQAAGERRAARAGLSVAEQWPLVLDDRLGVRSSQLLQRQAPSVWQVLGERAEICDRVRLELRGQLGHVEILPDDDHDVGDEHTIDEADDGVDEAGHLVVLLA